jgi:hypothetical protein
VQLSWANLWGGGDDAQPYLERIFQLQTEFEKQGLELMRNPLYSDENMDMVLDGLRKAGLALAT